ncbi:MAG: hypothetical protein E6K74_05120 [Candidatus Eisenbacteria bacterium]|uniref:Lipoprotein n=1 Tax=Eiseniibacteriota bacterium TaxID=2212470 RepID=A0A538STP5_UNCEI|nr:MAG: hypothetical protein E6K74_05120 [Candidatus Eisenbacteria bacterium]
MMHSTPADIYVTKGGLIMFRRLAPVLLVIALVVGCAGTSKLSEKSEQKLAGGDAWRAWHLATRALDKEPGNPRARAAATAAGASIAEEWQRRIRALAEVDSMGAAEEVLKLAEFRANAAHYATVPVGAGWPEEERTLRRAAARLHYQNGIEAFQSKRPKKACGEFSDAERFVTGYRDAAKRADRALDEALSRVAVVPFRASPRDASLGVQVARAWRDELIEDLAPPAARFTRIMAGDAIERDMRVSDLDGLSRREAIRLGRVRGAQRVVWGSIGNVQSSTRLNLFKDTVARRVVEKGPDGRESTYWMDVPIEVVARVRDVTVHVDYEVIDTESEAALAHRQFDRSTSARVVWTSSQIEGDPASYSLVSDVVRTANPNRAREVEKQWASVCGNATTLAQVLEARRKAGTSGHYDREALPRFIAGAAFVFLEDLPPANDLALSALSHGSGPLREDLLRLDPIDEADLDVGEPADER